MSNTCTCRHPQFFIPRSAFPFDEKATYVDSVLTVLIESRFGFGYDYQLFEQPGDGVEREPKVFYDLTDAGMQPFYALLPLGRKGCQVVEAACRRAKQMEILYDRTHDNISATVLSPHHGRGSP